MNTEIKCWICGGPATQDSEQDNTIYCKDETCAFIGVIS